MKYALVTGAASDIGKSISFFLAKNNYNLIDLPVNLGLAGAFQTGMKYAFQKGYDAARKGLMSISDYASGTGKSFEELSQKLAMITRSTASYQSIADQFSGILPATSADFLAQAQAAGFLSKQYKKLTDVPISEYQKAVTEMLARRPH